MFDWVGTALEELWRNMMFGIIDFGLNLNSSFVSDIIMPASKLSFLKSPLVVEGYKTFSVIALSILVVSVLFSFIGSMIRGDLEKRFKQIIIGSLCSVLLIVVTQPLVDWAFEGISEAALLVTTDDKLTSLDDTVIRTVISASNPDMTTEDAADFVSAYREANFDYNAKDDDDNYIYTLNPFPTLLISFIVLFLLLFIALQIVLRVITVAFLKAISPFASITLVSESSQGAKFVYQQILNALAMTAIQIWILLFCLTFIGEMTTTHFMLRLIILCVGFLFVLQAPSLMSGITGGQQGSLLQTAQSALMGANAGRALSAGAIGSVLATGNGLAQTFKGALSGSGKGVGGAIGNMATAPLRFSSGMVRGDGKTVMNNEGSKANQMGAKAKQGLSSALQKGKLTATGENGFSGDKGSASSSKARAHDSDLKGSSGKGTHDLNSDASKYATSRELDSIRPTSNDLSPGKSNQSKDNEQSIGSKNQSRDVGNPSTGSGFQRNAKVNQSDASSRTGTKRTVANQRSANHRLKSSNKNDN